MDSTENRDRADRMLPTERNDSSDSRLNDEPEQPIERNDPLDPIERHDPTLPMDSTDPVDQMDSNDPRDLMDQLDSATVPP